MSGDLQEGLEGSAGDPRVLFVLNVVLSGAFAYLVLFLSDLVGITTLTWSRWLGFTLLLVVLTYLVTRA
ncbi:hypothetical protein [Natronobiforma cellulositropha]|uniref:hypothetical protein n=1 Tax=Natronobiforma cellulositropha TaxID=1679076 RepID=UPI0021D610C2|nr:hypothetical protein [Natronobiforma cellulositropha]